MTTRIGYWASKEEPDLPVPRGQPGQWLGQENFLLRLNRKEKTTRIVTYKGMSPCRICSKTLGSSEHNLDGFKWPDGLKHYVNSHNVKPPQEFIDFIMGRVKAEAPAQPQDANL